MQFVSRYVFYTFSILLPSHSGVAAGLYINCTPPLEETSNHPNKQRKKETKKHRYKNKQTNIQANYQTTYQPNKQARYQTSI
jgi:hypothetical protein